MHVLLEAKRHDIVYWLHVELWRNVRYSKSNFRNLLKDDTCHATFKVKWMDILA